jgi:RNA polymerase sigma-70 factor, ECF subfamily
MSSSFPERAVVLSATWRIDSECEKELEGLHSVKQLPGEHRMSKQPAAEGPVLTDEEAMLRLKAHDKNALALLFDRYSRLLFTIAFRILRDHAEAEDVMQSIFLDLYQNSSAYNPDKGSAKTWISQRAYYGALDRRDFLAYRQIYLGTDPETHPDRLIGDFDLERITGSKLLREQLTRALGDLPEKQSLTLQLNFFEGLNMREIGERLGETLDQVRHHYYRGLDKLRRSALVRSLRDKTL